jgi:hypothetical protein
MFILLVGLSLSIVRSAQGQLEGRQSTEIQGVTQDGSGAVIPNVTITVTNKNTGQVTTTTSDSEGRYKVRVEPGLYDVKAELSGFKTFRVENVSAQLNQAATVNIVFDDSQPIITVTRALFIKGVVKNYRDGRPIENATVTIKEVDGDNSWTPKTGRNGKYKQELPPGKYKLTCKADGFLESDEKLQELQNGTKTQDFRLKPE